MIAPRCQPLALAAALLLASTPASAVPDDAARTSLEATENAFAGSVLHKDKDAFAARLDENAAFIGPDGVTRGKAAILEAWAPLFAPGAPSFEWHPEIVELSGDGAIGITRGPWVIRSKGKDGQETERRGTFNSVWRKDASGGWKIIFDAGCPCSDPKPGSAPDPKKD
ncbi:MAG TPA: nuclear transport factor 2 family protein [Thermoanaerobaculia bacterium]|nr:nuclear transport factor 2 family protein [Thermoanaerobaculia bacterium]